MTVQQKQRQACWIAVFKQNRHPNSLTAAQRRHRYPDADAYTMQFLLDGYEDSICPDGVAAAGKAAYVERNQAMIQASDFCVFYFNNEYLPASRKESKKAITSYQPKSGTGVAFDYAKAHGRTIINLYEEDEHCN